MRSSRQRACHGIPSFPIRNGRSPSRPGYRRPNPGLRAIGHERAIGGPRLGATHAGMGPDRSHRLASSPGSDGSRGRSRTTTCAPSTGGGSNPILAKLTGSTATRISLGNRMLRPGRKLLSGLAGGSVAELTRGGRRLTGSNGRLPRGPGPCPFAAVIRRAVLRHPLEILIDSRFHQDARRCRRHGSSLPPAARPPVHPACTSHECAQGHA